MSITLAVWVLLGLSLIGFVLGYRRAWAAAVGRRSNLHSLPTYHGLWVLLCMLLPALTFVLAALAAAGSIIDWLVWSSLPEDLVRDGNRSLVLSRIETIAGGEFLFGDISRAEADAVDYYRALRDGAEWFISVMALALGIGSGTYALPKISDQFRARNIAERIILFVLLACSTVAILTTIGIVFSLLLEALHFFAHVSPIDFLFGLNWSPQAAVHAEQEWAVGAYGVVPVFAGTVMISFIAMAIAVPIGLLSAIYMVEFADPRFRAAAKPTIEVLAGIPTVVYGFFAAVTVAPFVRDVGGALGFDVSSESALAAGGVLGIMIIPFISSLSDDVISTVPQRLREGAYSLGATHGETIFRVVLPAALPGLLSALVLAVSRALGETMIVVMAAGLFANLTANPFEAVTTVTVQIATVLVGDQPFDSPTTLSAFALGLSLFVVTLAMNILGLKIMQRYREKYD